MRKKWTDSEVKTLRLCIAYRMSYSLIGKKLGRTKNSVIGKVHKLKLYDRPVYKEPYKPTFPRKAR